MIKVKLMILQFSHPERKRISVKKTKHEIHCYYCCKMTQITNMTNIILQNDVNHLKNSDI